MMYLGQIAWELGERLSITDPACQIANRDRDLAELASMGFAHFCKTRESLTSLAISSLRQTLTKAVLPAEQLDAVVLCTSTNTEMLSILQNQIEAELAAIGADRAILSLLSFGRCSNVVGALMVCKALLSEPDITTVALVVVDVFPDQGLPRNNQNNTQLMSDGAASCLVTNTHNEFAVPIIKRVSDLSFTVADLAADIATRVRAYSAYHQLIQALRAAILALEADLIEHCDCLITHNMSLDAVRTMADSLGICSEKVYTDNIARYAHVYCADGLINLESYRQANTEVGQLHRIVCLLTGINSHGVLGIQLQT